MRVKILSVKDGKRLDVPGNYPNFHKSGNVAAMKKRVYGQSALLVRCGNYIYNVTKAPHIYNEAH